MLFIFVLNFLMLSELSTLVLCQEPVFDIPVQLVGFPVIALSVRLANFAKKLMYSLNPGTYKTISKRSYEKHAPFIFQIKTNIIEEFGEDSCVENATCESYAMQEEPSLESLFSVVLRMHQENMSNQNRSRLLSSIIGSLTKDSHLCSALGEVLPCKSKYPKTIKY
ncbi:uncharacterized protein LOC129611525 [Condylostylus longicornis]|uniref:uncharacterized protein LOC129611525 n=1 Tax=Condylostylus longicornis TaxID=2530218 RepID=UPI00244DEE17|nr:uncharacterized protein LOC129611525 [Condylostylus longicornis]